MKRFLLLAAAGLMPGLPAAAQGIRIQPGTTVRMTGGAYTLVLHNGAGLTTTTPVTLDSLVIKSSGTGAVLNNATPLAVKTLQLGSSTGATLLLNGDATVHDGVSFGSGLLNLNGRILTLDSGAVLTGESEASRAIGPTGGEIRITQYLLEPLAEQPGNLGLIITSGADWGVTTIRRGHKVQTNTGGSATSIARYYEVTPANNTGLGAILRGYYFDAELNGKQESSLTWYRSANGGTTWTLAGASSRNTTLNYVNLSGVQSISRLTLSDAANPLPIDLLRWQAACLNGGRAVRLEWAVAAGTTPGQVTVEESQDGQEWQGAGPYETTGPSSYALTDGSPASFYRLRHQDYSGALQYSQVLHPDCDRYAASGLALLENPVRDQIALAADLTAAAMLQLRLTDAQGRLVHQVSIPAAAGTQVLRMPLPALATGLYGLLVIDAGSNTPLLQTRVAVQP